MARRTATTRTERESKVTSRITTTDDAPAEEKEGGLGYADAVVLVTTVLLLAAFVLTDYLIGKQFGKGMFFK
jgi:hypothetical protein